MKLDRRKVLYGAALAGSGLLVGESRAEDGETFTAERNDDWIDLKDAAGKPFLRYVAGKLPDGEKGPSVEGTCFTHPLYTPAGEVVTDLAPADHPHHRGVFCAWVQVEGEEVGDWWGWGAKAPKEGRLLLNREARVTDETETSATLRLINSWRAGEQTVMRERLTLVASQAAGCHILDHEYKFTTGGRKDVVIAQNPFGGFCYRAKPRGTLVASGPGGVVDRPNAVFDKKETNWPASSWYDLTYRTPEGQVSGVAVMDHPNNPLSTWHVVRNIHMLNPCIVAEESFVLKFGEPLYLRYRLVAHDGPAEGVDLEALYEQFASE